MTSYTNLAVDSEHTGAVVGVVGSGGVVPTGIVFSTTGGGVTVTNEIISVTTTNGQKTYRGKITAVNASGASWNGIIHGEGFLGVSNSTLYSIQAWLKYDTLTNATVSWGVSEYNGSFAQVNQTAVAIPTTTLTRYIGQLTTTSTTAYLYHFLSMTVANGVTGVLEYEITQRITVTGAWVPPYIPTTSTTSVAADVTISTITATGAGSLAVPAGVSEVQEEAWSAGGSPGAATTCEDGAASGAWGVTRAATVGGVDILYYSVPSGQTSGGVQPGAAWVHLNTNSSTGAELSLTSANALTAGAVTTADVGYSGGAGTAKQSGTTGSRAGSGGACSAAPYKAGLSGTTGSSNVAGAGHAANTDGGKGGDGGVSGSNGQAGSQPGGGAGGGGNSGGNALAGGAGQVRFSWLTPSPSAISYRRDLTYYLEQ